MRNCLETAAFRIVSRKVDYKNISNQLYLVNFLILSRDWWCLLTILDHHFIVLASLKLDLNWSISGAFAQIPRSFQPFLGKIFLLQAHAEHVVHAFSKDRPNWRAFQSTPLQKRLWRFWNHVSRWQGVCRLENASCFGWQPKQRRSPPVPCSHYKNKIIRSGGCIGD